MIRYGPAGIPLSCKGRTLKDGIEDVHNLALTALEIQMVRPMVINRAPDEDEEVGLCLGELEAEGLVIGLVNEDGEPVYDPLTPVNEEDTLLILANGPAGSYRDLEPLGRMAKRHDVALSLHTPYYMDLGTFVYDESDEGALSMQYLEALQHAGLILNALDGDVVVTNLGLYDLKKRSREDTDNNILQNLEYLLNWWSDMNLKPRIGIEITGHQDVFGSLDQVLDVCDEFGDMVQPVVNFPHYQARTKGSLQTASDYVDLLQKVQPYSKNIYASFSNVEYDPEGNEKWLTPLKKGDLKFERLADALVDIKPEITLISSSPLLEHDAVYMRTLTERVLSKKAAKAIKERKKNESATDE